MLARISPSYLDVQFVDYAGDYVYEVLIPQRKPANYGGFDSTSTEYTQNSYGPAEPPAPPSSEGR